ncbi:hypothetical protein DKX38_017283 [Salix brachista]|uniref:Uncharacterized protein n=1 Tax=Salix brachista TaxID=2182728 RepID=A0A5N5KUV8_9ROSI|nr:hypothetical protein DKX38_017283 [Salix brachista]
MSSCALASAVLKWGFQICQRFDLHLKTEASQLNMEQLGYYDFPMAVLSDRARHCQDLGYSHEMPFSLSEVGSGRR